MPRPRRALLAAAVGAAAYISGLYGDWLDDDPLAIVENADVHCDPQRPLSGMALWSHDFWGTPLSSAESHLSYRPLTTLSFRLQHCIVGFHAVSFHAVNLMLHSLVCVLFTLAIAPPVLPRRTQRTLAGLLFALHAVHVECVTNTVGRAELLSAVAFFSAFLLHRTICGGGGNGESCQRLLRNVITLIGTVGLAGGAMLCKEVGITALLVCAAYDVTLYLGRACGPPLRRHPSGQLHSDLLAVAARVVTLGAGGAALLYARLAINGWRTPQFTAADNPAAFCEGTTCRRLSCAHLSFVHLRLLVWPTDLAHDWSMTTVPNVLNWSDPRALLALSPFALLAALALGGLYALAKRRISLFVTLTFGSALMVGPFLPASNLFVTVGFTVAERVLYLPSAGFCVLLSRALLPSSSAATRSSPARRWLRRLVSLSLLMMHAVLTLRRNVDWRSNLLLLESGVRHQPTNAKLRYNLGLTYHKHASPPRHAAAIDELREARRLLPSFHEAGCVEANALRAVGRVAEAEALLRSTIERAQREPPTDGAVSTGVYYASRGLGELLAAEGRLGEAALAFLPALSLQPNDVALARRTVQLVEASRDPSAAAAVRRHLTLQYDPPRDADSVELPNAARSAARASHAVPTSEQAVGSGGGGPSTASATGSNRWAARLQARAAAQRSERSAA